MQKNPEKNILNLNIHAWLIGRRKQRGKKPGSKKTRYNMYIKLPEKGSCTGNGAKKPGGKKNGFDCTTIPITVIFIN